ncbi:MAG: hypothetical protein LBS24_02000 [Clostridiales Family XIII bacterium]|jgi:tetratricopeptide (TPR) repeat protein|nr:hypothetical protein [Clostridiales Family XIII bacterium]
MDVYEKKLDLIEFYRDSRNYEKMRLACLDALKDRPHDPWALSMLSSAYYNLRMYDECIGACLDAIAHKTSPYDRAYDYDRLAISHSAHFGDHAKAAKYARMAVEGQPGNAAFLAHYASEIAYGSSFYNRRKRLREALALFERAEAMDPENYTVLLAKNQLYRNFFRDREAEAEILARMVAVSDDPDRTSRSLADFHDRYKEYGETYEYCVKALMENPGDEYLIGELKELKAAGYDRRTPPSARLKILQAIYGFARAHPTAFSLCFAIFLYILYILIRVIV